MEEQTNKNENQPADLSSKTDESVSSESLKLTANETKSVALESGKSSKPTKVVKTGRSIIKKVAVKKTAVVVDKPVETTGESAPKSEAAIAEPALVADAVAENKSEPKTPKKKKPKVEKIKLSKKD